MGDAFRRCRNAMTSASLRAPRQVGELPPWSEAPRFEPRFWTEAPLVDRGKLLRESELGGTARRCQDRGQKTRSSPIETNTVPSAPRLAQGNLAEWSTVPRFQSGFWTEAPLVDRDRLLKERELGSRRNLNAEDHLDSAAQVHPEASPRAGKKIVNSADILRAKIDHLKGTSAEVNREVVPTPPLRQFDQNSGIVKARHANGDHIEMLQLSSRDRNQLHIASLLMTPEVKQTI